MDTIIKSMAGRRTSKSDRNQLAQRVLKLREKKNWTQREMAERFGLTPGAIAQWEMGTKYPNGPALKLLELYETIL